MFPLKMFGILRNIRKLQKIIYSSSKNVSTTFLSPAYYAHEVWAARLENPILQKVNLEELYQDLDQRYQKTRQMSAVDVDIFANALKSNLYIDEMLDLLHKLRLSADTGNTLNSTSQAVIRILTQYGNKKDLLNVLDDRINYGVFLDFYTANILMDMFWKEQDFTSGSRVASQLMLQEDCEHPVSGSLSLLHCYNFLLQPGEWPVPIPPDEPEEEIKIRVKYIRNPYEDDHFDLKDPFKIVGKTLALFTNKKTDSLNKSFNILGWILYDKSDKAEQSWKECEDKKIILYKEIIDLIPENNSLKLKLVNTICESVDIQELLTNKIKKAVQKSYETDIAAQSKQFLLWNEERIAALEEQKQRLLIAKRLAHIEEVKKTLEEKETKLWFFDHEEQIELNIEEKKDKEPSEIQIMKKTTVKSDEDYIPPEVWSKQTN